MSNQWFLSKDIPEGGKQPPPIIPAWLDVVVSEEDLIELREARAKALQAIAAQEASEEQEKYRVSLRQNW